MSETTGRPEGEQDGSRLAAADLLTLLRFPLAAAYLAFPSFAARLGILAAAAASDLLDGPMARRRGASRFGAILDPIADKVFMACAFGVVLVSGRLAWYEVAGVLLRDLWAAAAFVSTIILRRPVTIPARYGGKAVTVAQVLTLAAFLTGSPLLRPLAWATAAVALYAIRDYHRAAAREARPLGGESSQA